MEKDNTESIENKKHRKKKRGAVPKYVLIILLLIYFISNVMINIISRGNASGPPATIPMLGVDIPLTSFTGVFSSIGNICLIFMVVYFGKLGFISALALILVQIPLLIIQFFAGGNAMAVPGVFTSILTIIAIVLIYKRNKQINRLADAEIELVTEKQKFSQRLFEQTATALVNAIDAKDTYSHGHSIRVAQYSEKIARALGKDDDECYRIYYAALLHDVGKIGIQNAILNKKGKLTPEEYETIKSHPFMGYQILSSITEYPYLSLGAHYHHERYDGKGYPDHLKGEDIPEIARIISVADAYDAMSSNRSYRDAIPQQIIREEFVKGAGTQFDPKFAKIMLHLIDKDVEYIMREKIANKKLHEKGEFRCTKFRSDITEGILLSPWITKIHFRLSVDKSVENSRGAAFVLFDSLDGHVHTEERAVKEMLYSEYGTVWMNGVVESATLRKTQTDIITHEPDKDKLFEAHSGKIYDVEAVKRKDHAMITIDDGERTVKVILALPDSSRYVYLGITGEYCSFTEGKIERTTDPTPLDYIPRLVEAISYIKGKDGDVPSVQVDGHRTEATPGITVTNRLDVSFHTMSLPTARLIWHCPYLVLFHSDDGIVRGRNYKEYALVRLDGELIDTAKDGANDLTVEKSELFKGWDAWKDLNKKGMDCAVSVERSGDTITITTTNFGIYIKNVTKIEEDHGDIYFALSGDQCAITNIKIKKS